MEKFLLILLLIITGFQAYSATDTSEGIFDQRVRSLQVRNPENFMAPPIIRLSTDDRLRINFDIIGDQHEYLRYRLVHCNADWTPSRLLESEYVDGFNEVEIDDYAYSSNTFVHYVNYNIELPNPDLPFLTSGNYVLQVYPEGEPDDILLQARFSVTENTVGINGIVSSRTDKGFNTNYQQLSLGVAAGEIKGVNPYQDLVVTVTMNNRPETTRTVSHPLRIEGRNVIFDHDQNLIFDASNEYRRFETVRADYPGMHVDSVRFEDNIWHAWLAIDEPRNDKDYTFDHTQKGRFMIDEYNADDPDLGADYIVVHFSLDAPYTPGIDIYVDGDFNNHRFDKKNLMSFDHTSGLYTLDIPLKQGSYNYQYVVVPQGGGKADPGPVEGNKYETGNEYEVKVFLRLPGARADRLVGSGVFSAGQ